MTLQLVPNTPTYFTFAPNPHTQLNASPANWEPIFDPHALRSEIETCSPAFRTTPTQNTNGLPVNWDPTTDPHAFFVPLRLAPNTPRYFMFAPQL